MLNYGKTVNYIRKSKHMSQEYLAKHIMSRSNLSRFEQGNYEISFAKFIALIDRLSLSVDEFLYISNGYDLPASEKLYRQLVVAENAFDLSAVYKITALASQKLYCGHLDYELTYYTSQRVLWSYTNHSDLSIEKIKQYVKQYLFDKDNWFFQEFRLLNNFLSLFDTDLVIYFIKRGVKEFEKYSHILSKNNIHVHLLLNASTIFYERNHYSLAKKYFLLVRKHGLYEEKFLPVILSECYLCLLDIHLDVETKYSKELFSTRIDLLTFWGYHDLAKELLKKWSLQESP